MSLIPIGYAPAFVWATRSVSAFLAFPLLSFGGDYPCPLAQRRSRQHLNRLDALHVILERRVGRRPRGNLLNDLERLPGGQPGRADPALFE